MLDAEKPRNFKEIITVGGVTSGVHLQSDTFEFQ